ncbi:MAG: carboxylating nicotinate-nucleotide diphosphorylase [wastewater metagenome]|nr:carboxylating nicotinate-nucleotide diphosphorylase [Candidatus Loosdrechtia aerotolerans]
MDFKLEPEKIDSLIQLAIQEDIGIGDITTKGLIPGNLMIEGAFIAKENGIIAGLPVVEYFFSRLNTSTLFKEWVKDGSQINKGEIIATISGNARTLLSGERIALNFLQRLSGIATLTSQFVQHIKPLKTAIMDTRKTIPGWRYLEKYAVVKGGGVNHRTGLYDQILIKDNHLNIMKNRLLYDIPTHTSIIEKAVSLVRQKIKSGISIEVETRTREEVEDALKAGVDIILFDNMDIVQLKEVVRIVREWKSTKGIHSPLTEASGNITLENVHLIAQTGVDRISIGAITHSAKALDISLEISGY